MVPTGPQQDATGTFYYGQDGKKYYVSPSSMPGRRTENAPEGQQWNQGTGAYEANRTMGERIAPWVPVALATAGIGSAMAGGGGAPAATGAGASAGGGGATTGGVAGGVAATAKNVVNRGVTAAMGGGSNVQQEGGNGGKTMAALLGLAGLLGGRALSGGNQRSDFSPQLSQMAQMGVDRMAAQNPMFNATNQGMHAMLPNFARQGTSAPGMVSGQAPAPQMMPQASAQSGGGTPSWLIPLLAGAGGFAANDLLNGQVPFADLIKKLGGLFGGGQDQDFSNAGTGDFVPPVYSDIPTDDEGDY
jgi:hypothetical protein